MAMIDFESADWGPVEEIELCDADLPGNTLTDATHGVSFIIADGSMEIINSGGNHVLFFSDVHCDGGGAFGDPATLVIR